MLIFLLKKGICSFLPNELGQKKFILNRSPIRLIRLWVKPFFFSSHAIIIIIII